MLRISTLAMATVTVLGLIGARDSIVPVQAEAIAPTLIAASSSTTPRLGNGVYLYGESPRPGLVQQTYLVFEVKNKQVVGAVFMPNSSYDCFHGTLSGNTLNATVLDSYADSSYPATASLDHLYAIPKVEADAQALLTSCHADAAAHLQANSSDTAANLAH